MLAYKLSSVVLAVLAPRQQANIALMSFMIKVGIYLPQTPEAV